MNPDSSVSAATTADLPAIAALVNSAYRGESSRAGWTSEGHLLTGERTSAAQLRQELTRPHRQILCLREAEEIVGCVYLELRCGEKNDYCYLGMLTVKPTLQNQSLGRKLMAAAEGYARGQGMRHMILGVIQLRSELIAWYERRGYRPNGETKPFPPSTQYPRLTAAELHFVFMEKAL
jgi:predicted N-acetyltransferase YhbS